tara:strand:- start:2286 stop:2471 length:186 start_codon:yes stop_codon:yes gene_type:complete
MYESHVRFLGAIVLLCSIFTGIALISKCDCFKLFGGVLIISYTLLQVVVGYKNNEDEGEDI